MDLTGFRRLRGAVRSAFRGLRATPLIFLASAGTLTAGLVLLGVYLLALNHMPGVLAQVGEEIKLVAFLEGEASSDGHRDRLLNELTSWGAIGSVRYVPPEEALERLRSALGPEGSLVEGLESNPLPASVEIHPAKGSRSAESARALADRVAALSGVAEVRYGVEWVEGYTRILRAVEWVGVLLGGFLLLVLGAIVAGTVRLALHSREEELRIQRLVGAGTLFVRLPFYIEGVLQGALAAAAAVGILYVVYTLGLPLLGDPLRFLVGRTELQFLDRADVISLFALGIGLGAGGAAVSLVHMDDGT
jgi:cell division transport system permease protein